MTEIVEVPEAYIEEGQGNISRNFSIKSLIPPPVTQVFMFIAFSAKKVMMEIQSFLSTWLGCALCGTMLIFLLLCILSNLYTKTEHKQKVETGMTNSHFKIPSETLVFPGFTSHTRLSPKLHSFRYRFLIAAVPVRSCSSNWLVSIDNRRKSWWRRGWLQIDPEDHLQRGGDELGLSNKLDEFLKSRAYDPSNYPTVWLVTSPKLLGYKSNQASFWYLYSSTGSLDLMVIEANNTFDERKVWVVPKAQENKITSGIQSKHSRQKFHHSWPKEFHVSPFNSTNGFYSVSTFDRFTQGQSIFQPDAIDVTITLLSSQRRPKLVARLWSTSQPLLPSKVSILHGILLLFTWFWSGPLILPRTLYHALVLSKRLGLKIRDRPEPKGNTIARCETAAERRIRDIFIKYMEQITLCSNMDWHLSIHDRSVKYLFSTPTAGQQSPHFKISVSTPKFYATIIACGSIDVFLYNAMLHEVEERRTAETDDSEAPILLELLKSAADDYEILLHKTENVTRHPCFANTMGFPTTQSMLEALKSTVLSRLLLVWPCVTFLRRVLLKTGGETSFLTSSISAQTHFINKIRMDQVDKGPCSVADASDFLEVTDGSKCFLDHFVRQRFGATAQLDYLSAQLMTAIRERILSVIGGG